VKGLQDEIHYLEMELKLLKEKEVAKQSHMDHLETFFGDGIPINENILGLKNGFNGYKSEIGKKVLTLEGEKREREQVIEGLGRRVAELTKEIREGEQHYKDSLTSKSDLTHEKVKLETALKQQTRIEEETLRNLKVEKRRVVESISDCERNKEMAVVGAMKL
jgi:hypothetical protein